MMICEKLDQLTSNTISDTIQANIRTLKLCQDTLTALPNGADSFFHKNTATYMADEIMSLTEKVYGSVSIKTNYSYEIKPLHERSETEKRMVAMLNHFITLPKSPETKGLRQLRFCLPSQNGDTPHANWSKDVVDKNGIIITSNNPIKLYQLLRKLFSIVAEKDEVIDIEKPSLDHFFIDSGIEHENATQLNLSDITLSVTGFNDGDIDCEAIISSISDYAVALKSKEDSLLMQQQALVISLRSNKEVEALKSSLLKANESICLLKNEQLSLQELYALISELATKQQVRESVVKNLIEVRKTLSTMRILNDQDNRLLYNERQISNITEQISKNDNLSF